MFGAATTANGYLVLGGGGGSANTGVPNLLVRKVFPQYNQHESLHMHIHARTPGETQCAVDIFLWYCAIFTINCLQSVYKESNGQYECVGTYRDLKAAIMTLAVHPVCAM